MNSTSKTIYLNGIPTGEIEATGDPYEDIVRTREFLAQHRLRDPSDLNRTMLAQAVAFQNWARRIYDFGLAKTPADGLSIIPFVVNSAFAIEIYLKTIGQMFGQPLHGHKLLELYDALPCTAQDEIAKHLASYKARDGEPVAMDLRAYLEGLNNAFVEWRYSYESGQASLVHPFEVYVVLDVLHTVCEARLDA